MNASGGTVVLDPDTYIPYCIGLGYLAVGIFLGREMVVIGSWIAGCGAASIFPDDVRWLWFAVNGGGGLIVTGLLLRRQLHRR